MKLKFVWTFAGPDGLETAKHHAIHLDEYLNKHGVKGETGTESSNEMLHTAFLICDEMYMDKVKLELRPPKAYHA